MSDLTGQVLSKRYQVETSIGRGGMAEVYKVLMDFIEGTSLRREIFEASSPFPLQRVLEVMRAVCGALHYAHSEGVIQCDVKPGNTLIEISDRVLVSDFGIARMAESATPTMVGAGTPAYMALEQVRGESPKLLTDIYGLGVIVYELLTGGERPFIGEQAQITGSTKSKIQSLRRGSGKAFPWLGQWF